MDQRRVNLEAAQAQLQLTPQERALYERHLANLYGPGKVVQPTGDISTLYQMNVTGPEGKAYNIPSVYEGQIVAPEDAIQRAAQYGWNFFPSYATPDQAEARYQQMHHFMDQDTSHYQAHQRLVDTLMQQRIRKPQR